MNYKILIFGDKFGIDQLLRHIPCDNICGFVAATIRPTDFLSDLTKISDNILIQPRRLDRGYKGFVEQLRSIAPDIILINSYSMILSREILDVPKIGSLNLHGALLPKNRGPHPEQWAIINGEAELGVTLHEVDSGVDTGAIVDAVSFPLRLSDTWKSIRARLADASEELLIRNKSNIISGVWRAVPQNDQDATVNPKRNPNDSRLDISMSSLSIYNYMRALLPPMPPAFIELNERRKCFDEFCTLSEIANWKLLQDSRQFTGKFVCLKSFNDEFSEIFDSNFSVDNLVPTHAFNGLPRSDTFTEITISTQISQNKVVFNFEKLLASEVIGYGEISGFELGAMHGELRLNFKVNSGLFVEHVIDSINLATKFGFEELELDEIFVTVDGKNSVNLNAFQRVGFRVKKRPKGNPIIDRQNVVSMSIKKINFTQYKSIN